MKSITILIYICTSLLFMGTAASAVETAPRISDREIIESLTGLKQQQKNLAQQIQQNNKHLEKQIQQTRTDLERQIKKSHDSLTQRIDDMMLNFNYHDPDYLPCGIYNLGQTHCPETIA